MEPEVGNILEGKVTTITKFGAFVSLGNGKSGLVHISEIANTFVNDVHDYLQEGQTVKVLVISNNDGKINLSIKRTLPKEERSAQSRPSRFQNHSGTGSGVLHSYHANHPSNASRPSQNRNFSRKHQVLSPSGDLSFEDKLKQFMTASEGKMADLNRNIDGKRGGGRRRK